MIDLEQMYQCEREFPVRFAEVVDRPYGRLFCNPDNPLSNDSNHGIILRLDVDLDETVDDLVAFYHDKGLVPRLYPGFLPGEWAILKPVVAQHGFQFGQYTDCWFVLGSPSSIRPNRAVEVRRVRDVDESMVDLLCCTEGSDRTVRVLRRHLQYEEFHCFVGYVGSQAVTMGSFDIAGGLARVDNVLTHPQHRNRGYCRALIHHMVSTYPYDSGEPLYLWANNPVAMRIYREAGFVEFGVDRPAWGAWRS